jgi:hypothetical protein
MTVRLVVIYPRPNDIEAFETAYNRDHVPMAVAKLAGKTKWHVEAPASIDF